MERKFASAGVGTGVGADAGVGVGAGVEVDVDEDDEPLQPATIIKTSNSDRLIKSFTSTPFH
jgi:hypothetical protein